MHLACCTRAQAGWVFIILIITAETTFDGAEDEDAKRCCCPLAWSPSSSVEFPWILYVLLPFAMPSAALVTVILGGLALYIAKALWTRKKSLGPLPPGPKPTPIVGNISDLPAPGEQDWIHWMKHKDLYGRSRVAVTSMTVSDTDTPILHQDQSVLSR